MSLRAKHGVFSLVCFVLGVVMSFNGYVFTGAAGYGLATWHFVDFLMTPKGKK